MSGSSMGGGFGSSSARLAALTGTPLALLFGVALARTPAPASETPRSPSPTPIASAEAALSEPSAAPSQYCLSRMLSPLRALAADPNDPSSNKTGTTSVEVKATDGALEATVAPVNRAQLPWLDRVEEVGGHISERIGGDAGRASIQTVIATVPDPLDSGLGYEFDVELRALSRALEEPAADQSRFYRDHGWLPWDDRAVEPSKQRDSAECRYQVPGVALFRGGQPEHPSVRVLLLVGESPTAGLRQTAMTSALDIQARLDKYAPTRALGQARRVRIVGPAFSGTAQSMRAALRVWAENAKEQVHFELATGTATGSNVPEWLGTWRSPSPLGTQSDVSFVATTLSESISECSYLWYVHKRLGVDPVPDFQGARRGSADLAVPLQGVAVLSESGTEFGARIASPVTRGAASSTANSAPANRVDAAAGPLCPWAPSAYFQFPFHVSALRDAYEHLDQREAPKDSIARATSLAAPLQEAHVALDAEATPSDKTRAAQDLLLGNLLQHLSMREIRHVAIHATDIGDALFLARKIRDVAPDVRLAFFSANALLLHSNFQRQVLGSLVVSPYPFLGLSEFFSKEQRSSPLRGFESDTAQGLFNAALIQASAPRRGPLIDELSEYAVGSNEALPVWISTVGRGVLVPNQVSPTFDCSGRAYGSKDLSATPFKALCGPPSSERREAWRDYRDTVLTELKHDPLAARPLIWDFLFALLTAGFVLDWFVRSAAARRFASDSFPRDRRELRPENDQPFDRAIARTKWELYAAICAFVFLLAFIYMAALYGLDTASRLKSAPRAMLIPRVLVTVPLLASLLLALAAVSKFARSMWLYYRCLKSWSFTRRLRVPERVALWFGFLPPTERPLVAHTSFAQLRLLTLLAAVFAGWFLVALLGSVAQDADWDWERDVAANLHQPLPSLTLAALRGLQVTSGVSPSAPILVCMVCVYVWASGRMRRLSLAHGLSRATPRDREADLVSTPIRLILFPQYDPGVQPTARHAPTPRPRHVDAGFTEIERDLLNAVWRPITGRYFPLAAATLAFFPVVLFSLKPFLTLEGGWGTALLGTALALCTALVGVTLVQLVQFWLALERLLKRTMEHPLGAAFRSIPSFAKDSLDQLLSRRTDETLRWAACARRFENLARTAGALKGSLVLEHCRIDFQREAERVEARRVTALSGRPLWLDRADSKSASLSAERRDRMRATLEAALARRIVHVASRLTEVLDVAWRRSATLVSATPAEQRTELTAEQVEIYRRVAEPGGLQAAGGSALGLPRPRMESQRSIRTERRTRPSRQTLTLVMATPPPPPHATRDSAGPPPAEDLEGDALVPLTTTCSAAELGWLRSAQVFVATVVTLLVRGHVRQFRHFVGVTTGCSLLVLLAVNVYPFEPFRLLLTYTWVVVGSVVVTGLWIFIQMDRNTFISHVSGTPPGHLTIDGAFVMRVLAWAVIPVLGVAAAQYPEFANLLFGIVKPFTGTLR